MVNAPGWDYLIQGLYIQASQEPHLQILGGFFYAIILGQLMLGIYLKTEDAGTTFVTGLLVAGSATLLLPVEIQGMYKAILLITGAAILYKLFW